MYISPFYITVKHRQNKNPKAQRNKKKTYNQIPPFNLIKQHVLIILILLGQHNLIELIQ